MIQKPLEYMAFHSNCYELPELEEIPENLQVHEKQSDKEMLFMYECQEGRIDFDQTTQQLHFVINSHYEPLLPLLQFVLHDLQRRGHAFVWSSVPSNATDRRHLKQHGFWLISSQSTLFETFYQTADTSVPESYLARNFHLMQLASTDSSSLYTLQGNFVCDSHEQEAIEYLFRKASSPLPLNWMINQQEIEKMVRFLGGKIQYGVRSVFPRTLTVAFPQSILAGLVRSVKGNQIQVELPNGHILPAKPRGKLRLDDGLFPVCGDFVTLKESSPHHIIESVFPRQRVFSRLLPMGKNRIKELTAFANVEQLLILCSWHEPQLKHGFLNRMLVIAHQRGFIPIICFNKNDLISLNERQETLAAYRLAGYRCFDVSVKTGDGLNALSAIFPGKITALVGQSGVGKSSFMNTLNANWQLQTSRISTFSGKGKHTTTFVELLPLPQGGYLADTPGIKIPGLIIDREELPDYFPEFHLASCHFNNCLHEPETEGCDIPRLLEEGHLHPLRYQQYLNLLESL